MKKIIQTFLHLSFIGYLGYWYLLGYFSFMLFKRLGIDLGTPVERLLAPVLYVHASQERVYGAGR